MKYIFVIILLNFSFGFAQITHKKVFENEFQKILNTYSDSLNNDKHGIVNLTRHKNKTHKSHIGWANLDDKMTSDKVFNVGSLTKMFTAVLILQEIEKKTLKLNDTIGTFFSSNKNVDSKITIEQLLRHKSGLGEIVIDTVLNQAFGNFESKYNHNFLYENIPPKKFDKGEKFDYTNSNYLLLGYVLEILNDKPYSSLLQERIFDKCSMNNSYYYFSKSIKNSAHPMFKGVDYINELNYRFYYNFAFSAGCVSSNLDDLEIFFTNLYEKSTLISRVSFAKMIDFQNDYGYGIEKKIFNNKIQTQFIGHSGDNLFFKIRNWYNPKTKDLVITISNQYDDKFVGQINSKIFKILEK